MPVAIRRQNRVILVDLLSRQTPQRQHFPAKLLEGFVGARHLEIAQCRPYGLRRQAGVGQCHRHPGGGPVCPRLQHPGTRIAVAKRVVAVENIVGPTIPEVAEVKDGIDHRRRVARRHAARQGTMHAELVNSAVAALFIAIGLQS